MRRSVPTAAAVFLGVAGAAAGLSRLDAGRPSVVFIVLDTVRADHTSLCGYPRVTTPTLDALAGDGARHTCDAWSPASWTLPSHASYFTGVGPEAHHAHSIVSGIDDWSGASARARKLDRALPTLAEDMGEAGYQTLAVSGNPVIAGKLGLTRGFDVASTSPSWGDYFDEDLDQALDELLEQEWDPGRPLFLFVNIADAHQPWSPVPEGAFPGVPHRGRLDYAKLKQGSPWHRYIEGTMPADESSEFLARVGDTYDYAVMRADQNVARVLATLDRRGVCDRGCRFILTSDHGEFLGEHRLLDHGNYLWEGMIRVPVMTWGWDAPALEGPVSALVVHSLVRDGTLPEVLPPLRAWAWPHARRCKLTGGAAFCNMSVATRDGDQKLLWMDEEAYRIDLAVDPGETLLHPLEPDDPALPALVSLGQQVLDEAADDDIDPDVTEALRAAGYLE